LPFFTFSHFTLVSLFSLRSTSPLLQRKVIYRKASRRDFAELYGI